MSICAVGAAPYNARMDPLAAYDYHLPDELIARAPADPRDASRLFVYDTRTDEIRLDTFRNLATHLPTNAHLVMNDTRVVPARLMLTKETGGKIEVLLFVNEYRPGDEVIPGIVDRKVTSGAKLFFASGQYLEVIRQEEERFFFRASLPPDALFAEIEREGVMPIPPYIKHSPLSENELRTKYQTVFAKRPASVAAPTASLHFTDRVFADLDQRAIGRTFVTLHVGAGTFAPISEKNFSERRLFREYYEISDQAAREIEEAQAEAKIIIPVGTTACRTIESAAVLRTDARAHAVAPGSRATEIFIFPPYEFKIIGGLLTNFHIPRSSLMLLVDAFLAHKHSKRRILELYKVAIAERFRFYSFGDAMLIL